jgi:hypothetical protein
LVTAVQKKKGATMSFSLVENKWIGHIASTAARGLQTNTNRNRTCVIHFAPQSDSPLLQPPIVEGISQWRSLRLILNMFILFCSCLHIVHMSCNLKPPTLFCRRSSVPAPTEWLEMQLRSFELGSHVIDSVATTSIIGDQHASLLSVQESAQDDEESDSVSPSEESLESESSHSMPYASVSQRYFNEFDEIACLGRGGFG